MARYKITRGIYANACLDGEDALKAHSVFTLHKKEWYRRQYSVTTSSGGLEGIAESLAFDMIRECHYPHCYNYHKPIHFSFSTDGLPEPKFGGHGVISYYAELSEEQEKEFIIHLSTKLKKYFDKIREEREAFHDRIIQDGRNAILGRR